MANITGTNGQDTLTGTTENDTILGLAGNDRIIGGGIIDGSDIVDGGAGNDAIDYSNVDSYIVLNFDVAGPLSMEKALNTDRILNIETIIAPVDQSATIQPVYGTSSNVMLDVDLSKNRMTYSSDSFSSKTITIKNFNIIYAADGNARFKGNDLDNTFYGGRGDDIMFGSKGNDSLFGGQGKNTIDYSNLGHAVKLLPIAFVTGFKFGSFVSTSQTVEKQGVGTDRISASKIIGTSNKENTIDLSTADNLASMDLNLTTNSLQINAPDFPDSSNYVTYNQFEVINFVNAIGGKYNDSIVGANKNSKLTGGGGNDRITGGNKNDRITGSDTTAKGFGEVDILTGGGGKDRFILGDKNGVYYVGNGNNDYATITDFDLFQDSIDLGNLKNYSFALGGNNSIDLFSGKDVNTRDLVAKIQITGFGGASASNGYSSGASTLAKGSNADLEAFSSRLNILTVSSNGDAVI
jgi:RTX calcium-binding nonapeptide repeat (4 copies)